MAYSSSAPVVKIVNFGLTSGAAIWSYESTHAHAAVEAANFFTGCGVGSPGNSAVGMRVGDLVVAINQSVSGTSAITMHRVTAISSSTGWGGGLHASVSVGSS